jgi:hypothetical protein
MNEPDESSVRFAHQSQISATLPRRFASIDMEPFIFRQRRNNIKFRHFDRRLDRQPTIYSGQRLQRAVRVIRKINTVPIRTKFVLPGLSDDIHVEARSFALVCAGMRSTSMPTSSDLRGHGTQAIEDVRKGERVFRRTSSIRHLTCRGGGECLMFDVRLKLSEGTSRRPNLTSSIRHLTSYIHSPYQTVRLDRQGQ